MMSMHQGMLYIVCDGHSGVDAAELVTERCLHLIASRLPHSLPEMHQQQGGWLTG